VEPVPTQVAAARARYGIEVLEGDFQKAGFEDNSFDVVTAWHVLEHVAEPHELITEVHRIMRPGGLFACEVPNFDSLQAWLGRDRWFHLDVPRHLLQYTPEAVDLLLGGHGLRVVSRRTFSLQSGPFGMLESMLNRIGLPPNWLYRWVRRSVCEGDIAMLGLNLIAASLVAGPAFVAEAVACLAAGAGGVLGVIAVSG
jgi:SAM-dependent methyltransferase